MHRGDHQNWSKDTEYYWHHMILARGLTRRLLMIIIPTAAEENEWLMHRKDAGPRMTDWLLLHHEHHLQGERFWRWSTWWSPAHFSGISYAFPFLLLLTPKCPPESSDEGREEKVSPSDTEYILIEFPWMRSFIAQDIHWFYPLHPPCHEYLSILNSEGDTLNRHLNSQINYESTLSGVEFSPSSMGEDVSPVNYSIKVGLSRGGRTWIDDYRL